MIVDKVLSPETQNILTDNHSKILCFNLHKLSNFKLSKRETTEY